MTDTKPTAKVIALGRAQVAPFGGRMKAYQNVIALRFESFADFKRAADSGVLRFKGEKTGFTKYELVKRLENIAEYHLQNEDDTEQIYMLINELKTAGWAE